MRLNIPRKPFLPDVECSPSMLEPIVGESEGESCVGESCAGGSTFDDGRGDAGVNELLGDEAMLSS